MSESHHLSEFIGQRVVLDTPGHIVYLGTLEALQTGGFWLRDADVHDCRDGHDTKEAYVINARREGIPVNRKSVLVMAGTVISLSRLDDVVEGDVEE